MKTLLPFLVLFYFLIFTGCKERDENPSGPYVSSQDFPIEVGNWWMYSINDFYSGSIDTLLIEIASVKINSATGGKVFKCMLKLNQILVDSAIIDVSQERISYQGLYADYSYFGNYVLEFPFGAGDKWIGQNPRDTVKVVSVIEGVTLNGQKFSPAVNLKRSFVLGGGYKFTQTMMINPGVGIINQSIDLFDGLNAQKQNFTLIEYKL